MSPPDEKKGPAGLYSSGLIRTDQEASGRRICADSLHAIQASNATAASKAAHKAHFLKLTGASVADAPARFCGDPVAASEIFGGCSLRKPGTIASSYSELASARALPYASRNGPLPRAVKTSSRGIQPALTPRSPAPTPPPFMLTVSSQ